MSNMTVENLPANKRFSYHNEISDRHNVEKGNIGEDTLVLFFGLDNVSRTLDSDLSMVAATNHPLIGTTEMRAKEGYYYNVVGKKAIIIDGTTNAEGRVDTSIQPITYSTLAASNLSPAVKNTLRTIFKSAKFTIAGLDDPYLLDIPLLGKEEDSKGFSVPGNEWATLHGYRPIPTTLNIPDWVDISALPNAVASPANGTSRLLLGIEFCVNRVSTDCANIPAASRPKCVKATTANLAADKDCVCPETGDGTTENVTEEDEDRLLDRRGVA